MRKIDCLPPICRIDTADEKDEVSSTVSNLSELSGISGLSDDGDGAMEWRSASSWVQKQIQMGTDPRDVLKVLFSDPSQVPEEVDDITLWRVCTFHVSDNLDDMFWQKYQLLVCLTDCYQYDVRASEETKIVPCKHNGRCS